MANLKEIRTRISSVKSTRQITSAMKMVSAAKLRKAQQALVQLRPYADKINEVLGNTAEYLNNNDDENQLFQERKIENVLILVISSNRGLCGAFNSNIAKKTISIIEEYKKKNIKSENIKLICYGKSAKRTLEKKKTNIIKSDFEIFDKLNYNYIEKIVNSLIKEFKNKKYDRIDIIYNNFKNVASQELINEQFLPVLIPKAEKYPTDYIIEPSLQEVTEKLIPRVLTTQLLRALEESYTAEHGARMTAMHKATDNATDLIKELNLGYNKARQSSITNEILEIVGGAEALKG